MFNDIVRDIPTIGFGVVRQGFLPAFLQIS